MPAKTEKQRRFMGAELSRARAGEKTQTGMSESKLREFASKSMDAIDAYLHKVDIPDVKIKPGERIGGPGDRIQLVPKNPKKKGSEIKKSAFAKSMNLIDAYLFKHGRTLPCGHHAEDGDDIDKACTSGGCGAMGGSTSSAGVGAMLSSAPVTSSVTGKQTTIGALPGANTHTDRSTGVTRTSFSHTATGAPGDVDDFI